MIHNSTTRFSNRVEQYVKQRPSYPQEIIPFLEKVAGLNSSFVIADIGSGTGISSKVRGRSSPNHARSNSTDLVPTSHSGKRP